MGAVMAGNEPVSSSSRYFVINTFHPLTTWMFLFLLDDGDGVHGKRVSVSDVHLKPRPL